MNNFEWKTPKQHGADISFVPVCSNCKSIITDLIDFRVDHMEVYGVNDIVFEGPDPHITPPSCPRCGVIFDRIVMPTKLPFDNSGMIDISKGD